MAKEILLLGEFSTGKSAFINMMLGVSILPERLDSTNLPVIKIFSGEAAGLWLREAGQKYPRHLTRWLDIPTNWTEFEFGEITIPEHPLLKSDIIFWDTPGINSTNKHHEEHLQKFLTAKSRDIDLILFFVNKNITKTSLDFLNKWKDFSDRIYIIQNFRDTVNEKELRLLNDDMKLTVYTKYKNVPVEYLYIADICDEFNDRSEEKKDGLTEWDILHKWSERKIDITKLNGHTLEKTNWSFIQNLVTKSKCIDKIPMGSIYGKSNKIPETSENNKINPNSHSPSIKIGTQIWMVQNLDVDHYRNGDIIPEILDPSTWANLKTGAWCYYANNPENGKIYGKLYNWYAVNDPRGLAPNGYHVPTKKEFEKLIAVVSKDGNALKAVGQGKGSNTSGFSALLAGGRYGYGLFGYLGGDTYFWSSTEYHATGAFDMYLWGSDRDIIMGNGGKEYGFSIRCLKD